MSENMNDFASEYIKFYIDRFLYGNAEVESVSKKQRLEDMKRMLEAYEYLIVKDGNLNINDIRVVGDMVNDGNVCLGFRKTEVSAGDKATFVPSAKQFIIPKLNELIYHYNCIWNDMDPYLRESLFHIRFMRIHPFEDGNKRTGRLILSTNLSKQGKPPVIITKADTDFYYRMINDANYDEFAEFLALRSRLEDNTMCGFFKIVNGMGVLDDVVAEEVRKLLLIKK